MFKCQHQLAMCKAHDCSRCEFHGHENECPYARNLAGDTMPTFRDALEAYSHSGVSRRRAGQIEGMVLKSIAQMGLTVDDKLIEMTYNKFETLIERLQSPTRAEGRLRDSTILSYIDAFKTITHPGRNYIKYLRSIGRDPFRFSIPEFRFQRPKVQTVSYDQIRSVVIGMERWFASGNESDLSAALFLYFELFMGMRAGDVCRLKWGNIRQTNNGVMLVYTPHKTEKSSGVEVSFVIDPMDYEIIRKYIGKEDEYVIPRKENRASEHVRGKHGEYAGLHLYTRKKVNRLVSEAGIGNDFRGQKRGHALRKFRETVNSVRFGIDEAARRSGHTIRTSQRNYVGSQYSLVKDSSAACVAV